MIDNYLNSENTYKRLLKEYKEYGSLVVAYDFDNTVYDYHQQGHKYPKVIALLRQLKKANCYLIIFTANEDENFIKSYCLNNQIPFDVVNKNPPFFNSDARKIYYNVLLDDRAGLKETYETLIKLLSNINKQNQ